MNWVNWDFARRIPIDSIQLGPFPLIFHNDVSCFEFNHLKLTIFIMIFKIFFLLFLFHEICSLEYPKALFPYFLLGKVFPDHLLFKYLKLQHFFPPNVSYSFPCFIFLHCTYLYLTCNHLTHFIIFCPSNSQNVKPKICTCVICCSNPPPTHTPRPAPGILQILIKWMNEW